ncbi:MAG: hypothetical protein RSD55_00935 [Lachnospiraceae bacterium]
MGFFKRKKQKKLDKFAEIAKRYDNSLDFNSVMKEPEQVKKYVVEQCEQMGEAVTELENAKKEYDIVTKYLNDVQFLEDLEGEEEEKIKGIATNILLLTDTKEGVLNTAKKLSDAQFKQMELMEGEIPKVIVQLKENEAYQSLIKRDLDVLEGEKAEWSYQKRYLLTQQKTQKTMSFILFGLFATLFLLLTILNLGFRYETTILSMSLIFVSAVLGLLLFLQRQNNVTAVKQAELNMNQAVTLQNRIKIKYVNITTTVDYMKEKYHVNNAYELNYQWEQYLDACKEREKLSKTNEDLDYFNNLLLRTLRNYALYDAKVWTHQAKALIEPTEMVELKHDLLVRRQKLRSRMELQMDSLKRIREELRILIKDERAYSREIKKIMNAVDKICE